MFHNVHARQRCITYGINVGALLMFAHTAPAATPISPLALSCMGCHEPSVNSRAMPALRNLPSSRIEVSLRNARDAPQKGSIMARFAAGLSDADIARLARELGRNP